MAFDDGPVSLDQDWPAQAEPFNAGLELGALLGLAAPHLP
jgi:hypothetical protein